MKKIALWIAAFILSCSMAFAQQDELVSFNEITHDFGTIYEKDGRVTCDFIITNKSSEPLLIKRVSASCGCTTPSWTKHPIEPGQSGTVTASFNPKGQSSSFSKTVSVYTNLKEEPYRLRIKGINIKEKSPLTTHTAKKVEKNPADDFPLRIGNLFMKNQKLNFERINTKETKTIELEFFNNSNENMTIDYRELPKYVTTKTIPATIPSKQTGKIEVTIDASKINMQGYIQDEIRVLVDGKQKVSFPFDAMVLEKLNASANLSGKINVNSYEIDLKKSGYKILKISNSGKNNLNIANIQSSNALFTVSKKKLVIKPNEIEEIKVSVERKNLSSPADAKLTIISDDPSNQIIEVTVKAKP